MAKTITDKIDAVTFIPDEYRNVTPPIPKSCKIELTPFCNLKCWFCATSSRLREKTSDMDQSFYKRVVKELRELGVKELGVFYLGESFLCKWLSEAIRYAKEDCGFPYVFLTTNGIACTPEKIKECMAAGLNSLKFSFNYADEAQFAETTKMPERLFSKMFENIQAAHSIREENNYDCGIFASSIKFNGEQLQKMENTVEKILPYVDEHYWLPLYSQGSLIKLKQDSAVLAGNPGRIGALRSPIPCWAIFTELHIKYNGGLSLCCFDHDARWEAGNLNSMSIMEAWHSPAAQELRKAHLESNVKGTACESCAAYR